MDALDFFMRTYSSSVTARREMGKLYELNPFEKCEINPTDDKSRTVEIMNAYLTPAGLQLSIELEEDEYDDGDGPYDDDCLGIPDMDLSEMDFSDYFV